MRTIRIGPGFKRVLACHREGRFGTPRFLRLAQYDGKEPPEAYKNEAKLGVLLEYGTHLIDMPLTLLGTPTRVYARLSHGNPRMRGEHLAFVVFEYPETTAVIDIALETGRTAPRRVRPGRRHGRGPVRGHDDARSLGAVPRHPGGRR